MVRYDYTAPVILEPRYFLILPEDPPRPDPDQQALALIHERMTSRGYDEVSLFERGTDKYYLKLGRVG